MRIHLPRRRIWRAAIYLVSLPLVAVACDMLLVQYRRGFHPGYDTTRIVRPLMPDGTIDYLTAIENYYSVGVTPQNNAVCLIIQALGRAALPSKEPTDGITDRLGISHVPETGDYFVSFGEFTKQHPEDKDDQPLDPTGSIRFPLNASPLTEQWIAENAKPFALLTEASKRTKYFVPFNGGYRYEILPEILLPHAGRLRQASLAILARAMLRLQKGDFDGFHDDVNTVHCLARLLGQASTIVERRVAGDRLETGACEVERAAATSGRLSSAQAENLASELAALPDLKSLNDTLNIGERYMLLDTLGALSRFSPTHSAELINAIGSRTVIDPPQSLWLVPIPYEGLMRATNRYHDGMLAALQFPSYRQQIEAMQLQVADRTGDGTISALTLLDPDGLIDEYHPAVITSIQKSFAVKMETRLTEIALALSAYKSDHGSYPATLADLSPKNLADIPIDLFSDKPLIYSPTSNGYTLYSVGPNMIDDGGRSDKPADDIVASAP